MQRFNNKLVVVTGAASGIGKATVKRLLSEGANVIALDVNDSLLNKLNDELNSEHLTIQTLDISNVRDIESFFSSFAQSKNALDALINVAGILRMEHSHEENLEDWTKILNINLTGTFFMCRFALPLLLNSQGYIVNV